jgi:predicted Zn-dependent protease
MKPLKPANIHRLRAAEGWLELGNADDARGELAEVSSDQKEHPDVLEMSWSLSAREADWKACVKTAERLVQQAPERAGGWIHRSFALHELEQTEAAFNLLIPVREIFSDQWIIPYNLACYLAQLGRIDDAARELYAALEIDSQAVRSAAVNDPDLEPLRKCIDEYQSEKS